MMTLLEDALAAYAITLRPLPSERVPATAASNRVLAAPAAAETDLPRVDQSAMDGYALRAADLATASIERPVELPIALHVAASAQDQPPRLPPRAAARVLTGAMLPAGADTMIPQELAELIAGDRLCFTAPWPAQSNIRRRAGELLRGTRLAEAGQRVGPGLLASLVNAEVASVQVFSRPRIRVFVTGDEVRPAGTPLRPGEVHDSNGPLVGALLAGWGHACAPAQHLGDDETLVRAALTEAFADSDLVISCGGASVGDKDYLPAVAEALGACRVFWRVAQKPGKPIFFGVLDNGARQCAMLALPGNPAAVLIGMLLHVRAALDMLEGQRAPGARWQHGVLAEATERDPERTRLVRMQISTDVAGVVRLLPLPNQDSHMLGNLDRAGALAWIEAGSLPAEAGSVQRWTPLPG